MISLSLQSGLFARTDSREPEPETMKLISEKDLTLFGEFKTHLEPYLFRHSLCLVGENNRIAVSAAFISSQLPVLHFLLQQEREHFQNLFVTENVYEFVVCMFAFSP